MRHEMSGCGQEAFVRVWFTTCMTNDPPTSITVTDDGATDFTLVLRWGGTGRVFGVNQSMLMFALTATAILLCVLALVSSGKVGEAWPLLIWLPLILYVPLLNLVDRTTISVRDRTLSIEHGPLPWLRSRRIPIEEIGEIGRELGCVRAVLRDGTNLPLLAHTRWSGLDDDESHFIVEELKRRIDVSAPAGSK